MGYSPIKDIEVFNFMSYKHARVSFDDTNILNIKGYNDSGKSALLRATMICLADAFKRVQNKYIRYGCEYFRVVVSFEDGVSIVRDKYLNGQSLYEMYKDGKLIYTSKQGNRLTRIEGVPEVIRNYLGLCVTENGCLNYQSCKDRLLLIETTGSENYQELHSILKSEELSRAIQLINSDRNELNSSIVEMETELNSSKAVLESRSDVSEESIERLEYEDRVLDEVIERSKRIEKLYNTVQKLEKIQEIPKVDKVDEKKLSSLYKISELMGKLENSKVIPRVERLDSSRLKSIEYVSECLDRLESEVRIPEVKRVDVGRLRSLEKLMSAVAEAESEVRLPSVDRVDTTGIDKINAMNAMYKVLLNLESLDTKIKEVENERSNLSETVREFLESEAEKGVYYKECPTCGTFVEFNRDTGGVA